MNRRKFNVLQTILVKKKFQENVENELKSSRIITNDEYYRIKNIDELQQILKEKASNNASINTKEINKRIQLIFKKKSMISYLNHKETQLNNEYECNMTFERQLNEIVKALEKALSNDAIIQQRCCTTKC